MYFFSFIFEENFVNILKIDRKKYINRKKINIESRIIGNGTQTDKSRSNKKINRSNILKKETKQEYYVG